MKSWILLTVEALVCLQTILSILDSCLAAFVRIATRCGGLLAGILEDPRWSRYFRKEASRYDWNRHRRSPS